MLFTSTVKLMVARALVLGPMALATFLPNSAGYPALAQATAAAVATAPDSSAMEITTLKSNVRRVNVDVIVTDSQGHPVAGLTREDFKVKEANAPQPVRSFEVHALDMQTTHAAPTLPTLPPNTFVNIATAPESGTPTVLFYDALNTLPHEQANGQQEFLKFFSRSHPDSAIAVFVLSDKLHLVQGFNQDLSTPEMQKAIQRLADSNRWNWPKGLDLRVAVTLEALTGIGRFLAAMPGRKNLIWYSSSFPQAMFIAGIDINYSEQIKQAADLINLSHVAVYPVDLRGVRVNPLLSAAGPQAIGSTPSNYGFARQFFTVVDTAQRATMDSLADATGGQASYGTNDLQGAIDTAITSGSTYYSLTYEPTNPTYDGSLRHIKVTLTRPGYHLAYRRTYYADDLNAAAHAVADAPESPLTPALERGTPLSHGLFIEAHLDADGPPALATPDQMQVLAQYGTMQGKKTVKVPPVLMQQYDISYGLVARQLDMPADETGSHQASLEFGVISYDDDGRKLNGADTHVEDTIPAARYAKIASDGYHVVQSVFVPVTAASIRLAVRDIRGNRVGSLEVKLPLAKAAKEETPR